MSDLNEIKTLDGFLEQLVEMWEIDAEIGIDLSDEQRRIGKLHTKYFTNLLRVRRRVSELEEELEEEETKEALYLKGRAPDEVYKSRPHNILIQNKDDLTLYLNANKRIRALRSSLKKAKECSSALDEVLRQINSRSFRLNGILENEKFKVGLNK